MALTGHCMGGSRERTLRHRQSILVGPHGLPRRLSSSTPTIPLQEILSGEQNI
jgi:hypothetical protein